MNVAVAMHYLSRGSIVRREAWIDGYAACLDGDKITVCYDGDPVKEDHQLLFCDLIGEDWEVVENKEFGK